MTEIPTTEPVAPSPEETAAFQRVRQDAVLSGRAMSAGAYLAGLIAAAELDTVGRPDKLAIDMWPDQDAAVVQAIWDRALVVGVHAGRLLGSPRFHRDQLARLQKELAEAGHAAMAGLVGRSLAAVLAQPAHPADDETGREHHEPV